MLAFLVTVVVGLQPEGVATGPKLSFVDNGFVVVNKGKSTKHLLVEPPIPKPQSLLGRDGDSYVVWDQRGLTIRRGDQSRTTRMADLPTSPRFFDRNAIEQTVSRLTKGEISRDAVAVSGYEKIGSLLYVLLRWEDSDKKPWLEAIVQIDLKGTELRPEALGTCVSLSAASGTLSDELERYGPHIGFMGKSAGSFGLEVYRINDRAMQFVPVGSGEGKYVWDQTANVVLFSEKTAWGSYLAGEVSLDGRSKRVWTEARVPIEFPGDSRKVVLLQTPQSITLRSTWSGLELVLPKDVGVKTIPEGVLVWIPKARPTNAAIYSTDTLRSIARWPEVD